jgi:hypothetical protein
VSGDGSTIVLQHVTDEPASKQVIIWKKNNGQFEQRLLYGEDFAALCPFELSYSGDYSWSVCKYNDPMTLWQLNPLNQLRSIQDWYRREEVHLSFFEWTPDDRYYIQIDSDEQIHLFTLERFIINRQIPLDTIDMTQIDSVNQDIMALLPEIFVDGIDGDTPDFSADGRYVLIPAGGYLAVFEIDGY